MLITNFKQRTLRKAHEIASDNTDNNNNSIYKKLFTFSSFSHTKINVCLITACFILFTNKLSPSNKLRQLIKKIKNIT